MNTAAPTYNQAEKAACESATALLDYCRRNGWAGFDPYDALNSRAFERTPFFKSRICRIAITQIMKRLPINLRPLLSVSREQNPKAIAIFLGAFLKLSRLGLINTYGDLIGTMIEKLADLRSPGTPYWCWGYSFPWQTRTVLVPKGAANLVCTTFVADALLDAYESEREPRCLDMAVSAGEYMLNELFWTEGCSLAGFSYPLPSLRTRVHNANFLGAALFCRIYKHTGEKEFLSQALRAARYSAARQLDDGSWHYGELPTQRWVDNFHTGYNLCALRTICRDAGTTEFASHIRRGFAFYLKRFFREDGAPGYFHDRLYPIDIHSVAQSIITLLELKDFDEASTGLAHSVFRWAMDHMWDEKGYFYYRVLPFYKVKIPYMRWSQAWMLLALATFLEHCTRETAGT
ncbi:MAG TPA: hypothetical protein VF790_09500 [Dissulfurispiraceae bacterium]